MFKYLLIVLLALTSLCSSAGAQGSKTGPLPTLVTPDSVSLRWFLPNGRIPSGGFKVLRSSGGSSETFNVPSPLPKTQAVVPGKLEGDVYDELVFFYKNPSAAQSDDDKIQRAIFDLRLVAYPEWARALGILWTDKNLKAGVSYNYRILALDGGKETEVGAASATPGPTPALPSVKKLEVALEPNVTELQWNDADGKSNAVVAYQVLRAEGAAGKLEKLEPSPYFPSSYDDEGKARAYLSFRDKGVKLDTLYRYAVKSVDLFGRESALSPEIQVDTRNARSPQIPVLQTLSAGDKSVNLTWNAVSDNRVVNIVVLRGPSLKAGLVPIATLNANAERYLDSGVVPGKNYVYALALKLSSGTVSSRGQAQSVRAVNKTAPTTPSSLTATPKEDQLELSWKGGGESDLMGYYVLRSERVDAPLSAYVFLEPDPIAKLSYLDKVPAGVQHKFYYRVIAVNTSNVRSSPTEAVQASLLDKTPPPAPTLLEVSGLDGGIGIRFSTPRAQDLKQIEIFRADPQGKTVLVKAVAPDTLAFVDRSVVPNVTYAYAVTAVDASGNRSVASNYITARAFQNGAPDAPKGLKATSSAQGVTLEWASLPGGVFAVVYRVEGGRLVQLTQALEGTRTVVAGAKVGQTFALRAINLSGTLSEASEKVTAK